MLFKAAVPVIHVLQKSNDPLQGDPVERLQLLFNALQKNDLLSQFPCDLISVHIHGEIPSPLPDELEPYLEESHPRTHSLKPISQGLGRLRVHQDEERTSCAGTTLSRTPHEPFDSFLCHRI